MRFKRLGKTGLKTSEIGFGASPLGDVFGPVDLDEVRRSVQTAIEQGINLFDVSPYYGHQLAEERLGIALAGRRGEMQRGPAKGVLGIHVSTIFDKQFGNSISPATCCIMKRCVIDLAFQVHINASGQQQLHNRLVPVGGSGVDGRVPEMRWNSQFRSLREEHLHNPQMPISCGLK